MWRCNKQRRRSKNYGGQLASLLITDPPYNVNYEEKVSRRPRQNKQRKISRIQSDDLDSNSFYRFINDSFKNGYDALKDNGAVYCWYSGSESVNFINGVEDANFKVHQILIWEKNHFNLSRSDYQRQYEPCLYCWKKNKKHNWFSDRKQRDILKFDKVLHNDIHPTMKPVPLFEYQICNSTKQNDNVLDLFGGSGTTLIACEQQHRNAYIMELSPDYCNAIINRWQTLTGKKVIKL